MSSTGDAIREPCAQDVRWFDAQLSMVEAGFVLKVSGTVSDDRRYVTLSVKPNLLTVVRIKRVPREGGPPGFVVETPELDRWESDVIVSVPDRGTLMLVSDTLKYASMPPDGPVIEGPRRVLLLIKPTIIIQTEEETLIFPGLVDDPAGERPAP